MKKACLLISLLVTALSPAAAQAQADFDNGYVAVRKGDNDTVGLGFAYDLGRMHALPAVCVTYTQTNDLPPASTTNSVDILNDKSDFAAALDISYREAVKALSGSESMDAKLSTSIHTASDTINAVFKKKIVGAQKIINPGTVTLKPGLPTDPAAFRQKCGDYYVAGYIEGFEFRGTVSIRKSLLQAAAAGEVTVEDSFSALVSSGSSSTTVKTSVSALTKSNALKVYETSQGGYDSPRDATDLATLKTDYQAFGKKLTHPAWLKIILAPYDLPAVQMQSPSQRILEANSKLWYDLHQLLYEADLVKTKRDNFYPYTRDGTRPYDFANVQAIRDRIEADEDMVFQAISACEKNSSQCRPVRATLAREHTPEGYREQLPVWLGWPSSCTDVETKLVKEGASPSDGDDYHLFYKGVPDWGYRAMCVNLASSPATFFVFQAQAQAPAPDREGTNFSQLAPSDGGDGHKYYDGTMVTTTYRAAQIDPVSMEVISPATPLASRGIVHTEGLINGSIRVAGYGRPGQCHIDDTCGAAKARMDLRGTGFGVDLKRSDLHTEGSSASKGVITPSYGDQVVDMLSPCGHCAGIAGHLYFKPVNPNDLEGDDNP